MKLDATFVVPFFKSETSKFDNLFFALDRLTKTNIPILVVEQADERTISVEDDPPICSDQIQFITVRLSSSTIEKSSLINHAISHVRTEYVWVNDADVILRYNEVIEKIEKLPSPPLAIKPYNIMIRLTKEQTDNYFDTGKICLNRDGTVYPMVFGAASFLLNKNFFIETGGMDERFNGWGWEDSDLEKRIEKKTKFVEIELPAMHLYHPRPQHNKANYKLFKRKHQTTS